MKILDKLKNKNSIFIGIFCLFAVERLFRIYEAFSKRFSLPVQDYLAISKLAYDVVFDLNTDDLDNLKLKMEALIPDSEEYGDVLADQAQCAAIGMMYTLLYLSEQDPSMVEYVFEKVEESIDIFGYEGGDHEAVLANEEKWQLKLIDELSSLSELSKDSIKGLEGLNRDHFIPSV